MNSLIRNKQILISSNFNFNNKRIINLSDPLDLSDAATKGFVENLISVSGDTNIINPGSNYIFTSDGSNNIIGNSGLTYSDGSLSLNNISQTYAGDIILNNSSTTYIEMISTGITEFVYINYKAKRGFNIMIGNIELIYDISGDTLYIDDSEYSLTNDIGLTFDAEILGGIIQLKTIVTDDINDINFKYERKILK